MNDDEIGTALRQALAPPAVTPDQWSGQKLRGRVRARREIRTRRLSALASVVVVVALIGGFFGLVARTGGGDDQGGAGGAASLGEGGAAGGPTGAALLGTPLSLSLLTASRTDGAATDPPFLVLDQVYGHAIDGSTLSLALTEDDTAALQTASGEYLGRWLVIRAGKTVVSGPRLISGELGSPLPIVTGSEQAARALLADLGLRPTAAGLTPGAGAFRRPLRLYRVEGISGAPCVQRVDGRLRSTGVPYGTSCLRLAAAPAFQATAAEDVQVFQPTAGGPWAVRITLAQRDRGGLSSIGARAAEDWVFTVDGHPIGLLPDRPGADGTGFTIYFPHPAAAELAVLRLRG